jgi:uncharacterized membrane protein YbhN (UPF0104 family)
MQPRLDDGSAPSRSILGMRRLAPIVVKLVVSVTLLYFAVSRVNFTSIGNRLDRIEPGWILAGIVTAFLQVGLAAIRWRRVALANSAALSPQQALQFSLIGGFFNQVLPSTVGGDAARIWLLARTGAGRSKATYSVLLDRFFGVLTLAVAVTAGLPWSFSLIQNPVGRMALLVIGLGSLAGGAAFLALGRWQWPQKWSLTRHLATMAELARQILLSRDSGPVIMGLSLLIHVLTAAVAWALARSIAAPLEFIHAFLLVLPVILIATIPVSIAGWGVRESSLVLAFSYAGLPESDGLIVSMLLGGAALMTGLIGGIVWLAGREPLNIFTGWHSTTVPPPP